MKNITRSLFVALIALLAVNTSVHAQLINTIAGDATSGAPSFEVPATSTSLSYPQTMYVDKHKNVYTIDQNTNQIYKVDIFGTIHLVANATGAFGNAGDGGPATAATIGFPSDIFVDTADNIYFTDPNFSIIRKINPAGIISTICGVASTWGYSGDGGPATVANIGSPSGICGDRAGNIYFADQSFEIIRKIDPSGTISTIAGTPSTAGFFGDSGPALSAQFNSPMGIAIDTFGNMYIADMNNFRVRMIDNTGIISTLAGSGTWGFSGDGTAAVTADMGNIFDVHADQSGNNVYIADRDNNVVRKVNGGIINTVAGIGTIWGFFGDGGLATAANCSDVSSVFGDDDGTFYLTDPSNAVVRRVAVCATPPAPLPITVPAPYVCAGSFVTLGNAATGGQWMTSDVAFGTVDASGNFTGVSQGTATVTYSVTNECGANVSATVIPVQDKPDPGFIVGPKNTTCVGALAFTLSDPVTGGAWTSSNTLVATVTPLTGSINGIGAGTATISYAMNNSCGTNYATTVITVNTVPPTGIISGPASVCETGTATLSCSVSGGVWSSSNTAITVNSSGVVSGISPGTATISYTRSNSCGFSYTMTTVSVDPLPATGSITGTSVTCELFTTTLTGTIPGGAWSSTNTAVATIASASGLVTGVAPGTTTISYALTNLCGTRAATRTFTVVTTPVAATVIGLSTVCEHSTMTLSDAVIGGTWSSSDPTIASVSSSGAVSGVAGGVATISYSVTNSCGVVHATKAVTVIAFPVAAPVTGSASFCEGSSTALADTVTGGVWSSGNTAAAVVSSSGTVLGVGPGTATISYTLSNACASDVATRVVTIMPLPVPVIIGVATKLSTTKKYAGYQWYGADTAITGANSSNYIVKALGKYYVEVTGLNGCMAISNPIVYTTLDFGGVSGVKNVAQSIDKIAVYPNPSKGTFTISLVSAAGMPVQVTISNMLGQKVKELNMQTNTLQEVSLDQPAGIYIINITAGENQYTQKLTIE